MSGKDLRKHTMLLVILLLVYSCESVDPEYNPVSIDEQILADQFGNKDGNTEEEELTKLNQYFSENDFAFVLRGGIDKALSRQNAAEIAKHFYILSPVYKSKEDFRDAYNGVNLGHEAVGIVQLEYSKGRYVFTKFYRAPGNNVYASAWFTIELY